MSFTLANITQDMIGSFHPIVLMAILAGMVALVAAIIAVRRGITLKPTPRGAVLSSLPSLLMVTLFYSLAVHMYRSLGDWPAEIGGVGFSTILRIHASVAVDYTVFLLLITVFAWPIAFVVCVLVNRWRALVPHLAVHAVSFVASWCLFRLAPSGFLVWWSD